MRNYGTNINDMKKLLLAFLFLPLLSFAQSKTLNDTIPGIKNSKLIIS